MRDRAKAAKRESTKPTAVGARSPANINRVSSTEHSVASRLSMVVFVAAMLSAFALAQNAGAEACPRPAPGSLVTSPSEIKSHDGVLQVTLSLRNSVSRAGEQRYCYVDENGDLAPTLRVHPGDLLILKLKNELPVRQVSMRTMAPPRRTPCLAWEMQATSTNLHFHGLMIPPACHQDDVLNTLIQPGSPAYEYHFQIPPTQPPGLYWYHPHPHGHSEEQVLGGASGALIVEGIESFTPDLAGLPERVVVIRDQPGATVAPGSGPRPPSKDLSVNSVPVPYPEFPPSIIKTRPSQRELWRVVNASADTFLDLHFLSDGKWQKLGLVALDGVPLGYEQGAPKGLSRSDVHWTLNIPLPPGGRAEFLFDAPAQNGWLLTSGVDTAPSHGDEDEMNFVTPAANQPPPDDDDYTPPRWLVRILASPDTPELPNLVPKSSPAAQSDVQNDVRKDAQPDVRRRRRLSPPLKSVRPTRTRTLYFSERVFDPKNPHTSTVFYVTEKGHSPAPFDPAAPPNITVQQGDVEDWIIENRSQESHSFHIHQTHFIVLERENRPVQEDYLRDSIELPYWDGLSKRFPTVKLRIDFRDPAIVGTFPYHCHILQHEDGGMMGTIRVLPPTRTSNPVLNK